VFGKYKSETSGFTYGAEADCFTCLAGKRLPFKEFTKSQDGGLSKVYRAASRDCRLCPHKPSCAPNVKKKQLIRTAYAAQYRRAFTRQQSQARQHMRQRRQATIEPVFGSLLQHYGLRRVNTRGRSSAHKTMLLTAIAFNLKKLLKHKPQQLVQQVIALPSPPLNNSFLPLCR
jgi:hypothetical protein